MHSVLLLSDELFVVLRVCISLTRVPLEARLIQACTVQVLHTKCRYILELAVIIRLLLLLEHLLLLAVKEIVLHVHYRYLN